MEKLKIVSLKRKRQKCTSTAMLRASGENHSAIMDIVEETGRGVREVTDMLLEFALNHVEVTYDTDAD